MKQCKELEMLKMHKQRKTVIVKCKLYKEIHEL
jgi:hypothetical protein